jgi:predicted amidohydrolase YtcJ
MSEPATGAVVDATVLTLDAKRPAARAVAWRDDAVIAVGDADDVAPYIDGSTDVVGGSGAVVVPGLVDAHIHPFHGTELTRGADLRGARTIEQVRALLRRERELAAPEEWVLGHSVGYEAFRESGIRADAIEDAVDGRPALVNFFDGHTALASFEGMRRAGVDGPREFAENAEVACDADGRPTGALLELGAMTLVRRALPEWTRAERLDAYADTLRTLNSVGLTGAHVMLGDPELLDDVRELERRGELTLRMVVPMHFDPSTTEDEIERRLALPDEGGRLWRSGTAKFFLDGVMESGTAWQTDPGPGGANAAPFWTEVDRYADLVQRCTQAGFACITHAVADGAVRAALDAYEASGPPRRGMHRVEHIETLLDDDLPRFAGLGVAASMQPLHMEGLDRGEPAAWFDGLAPGRRERGWRSADIARTGAVLGLGSDWMVADYDPRVGMAWARLRREPGALDRTPYLPEQALSPARTLHGYTTCPAAITGDRARAGCLTPGRNADLTVLGANPLEVSADELPDIPVLATVVGGEVVFR